MFDKLIHSYKIRRRQAAQRRLDGHYRRLVERAKKANESHDDISQIYSEWSSEGRHVEDEILYLNSRFLQAEAERLFVPFPEYSKQRDQYEESEFTGKVRLTQPAQAAVRKAIRQERKEAAEQLLMWIPFLSLLIALASVAATILAIVVRH